ncbi:MAG: hypothetical protein C0518_05575 [Opitutus sp.]|nr:hypothetical protein [Opitutus sp.]
MKKPTAPAQSAPTHDDTKSRVVEPTRHESTGRTIGRIQEEGDSSHLFSATGLFIATVKTTSLPPALKKVGAVAPNRPSTEPTPTPPSA